MNQHVTQAIILSRTNYGEAGRILTVLTPGHGKLRLLAKGVRRVKSKLAGGIELFSVSTITYVKGRGDIGTLVSTRLITHYGTIVQDLERTMVGYELIKQLNKITEDEPEAAYFELLRLGFEALDTTAVPLPVIRLWFNAQLLKLGGHAPDLRLDVKGLPLDPDTHYSIDLERMALMKDLQGAVTARHIKFLRLAFADSTPALLTQVQGGDRLTNDTVSAVDAMARVHLHIS